MKSEIPTNAPLEQKVFTITNEKEFHSIALEVYLFQYTNNSLYRSYCDAIRRTPDTVRRVAEIPFLPISFFKTHEVRTTSFQPEITFSSSGTTSTTTSRHFVKSTAIYTESFTKGFEAFYGLVTPYCILGLLPSYLEREGSSLVFMADALIKKSGHPESGFYLHDTDRLHATLQQTEKKGIPTLLIGVTYALLDFAEAYPQPLHHTVLMETGGMKGRKKEMVREEAYDRFREAFGLTQIHAEYGMTELLSQAYAVNGRYRAPPWMQVLLRDETDPFTLRLSGTGAINVIDLANIYSCSFIATEDVGSLHPDGSFEVLGRMDNTDIRGCSLMVI